MSLFHSPEFVGLNGLKAFDLEGCRLLVGPERGTYGGFDRVAPPCVYDALLAKAGPCRVKLAPTSHDPVLFALSMNALARAGFGVEAVEVNYDLMPTSFSPSYGNAKKLRKCNEAGFVSRPLERAEWADAHAFLVRDRERAGHHLSVPLGAIESLESLKPGTHQFYGTFSDRLIAAAICLWVNPDILYVYAWGAEKSEYSPTVHLCSEIYKTPCRILDAGISTLDGMPNLGLMRFKESLGFKPSAKVIMRRA